MRRGRRALVDRECLPQVRGGLAGVAVLQVGLAESFQGACFLQGRAEVAGDGQRLGMVLAGLAGGRGPRGKFAEAVQRLGLAKLVAEFAERRQGLLVAGGGGRVVPGFSLDGAEAVEGPGLAFQVAEVTEQRQGLLLAGGGGRIVPGFLLDGAEAVEGLGLAFQVAEVTAQRQGLLLAGGGRRVVPGQLLRQAQVDEGVGLNASGRWRCGLAPAPAGRWRRRLGSPRSAREGRPAR